MTHRRSAVFASLLPAAVVLAMSARSDSSTTGPEKKGFDVSPSPR